MFSLELLKAINEWQRGGGRKQRARRGEYLKRLSKDLDPEFRQTRLCCFRQMALDVKYLWKLGDELQLAEAISSWTLATDMAKDFKGGVPPEGWQGVIFEVVPKASEVIVNLDALYRDRCFLKACEEARAKIPDFQEGIGRYGGSQREVVLEINSLPVEAVYALGGYSSSREQTACLFFGREPSKEEFAVFGALLAASGRELGPTWVAGKAKSRVIASMLRTVEALKTADSEPSLDRD